ncbi:muconolactone Delta-isomerase family protein [Streptomyces litmocidini]|uniref:Muconolactone Delta-isomerase family protein n=1 Tax=Streptomyces litmocidini TaxID=67318 RepID=A0ABW7U1Q7_9ACTN|nr:muconolactone Delta-isomerase family protein [Streptomyces sp. PanSC19]ROQ36027.1 muconolactone delta-isomerase [Streptomyces sp. PanSC19]
MALFAVLATQSPTGIPADEFRRRLPEGFAYVTGLVDAGVIRHNWIRVGASGGLLIYEVDSHEELNSLLYGNPLSPHLRFEVIPLAELGGFDPGAFEKPAA